MTLFHEGTNRRSIPRWWMAARCLAAWALMLSGPTTSRLPAQDAPSTAVLEAEKQRVESIARASKASISVFGPGGRGGGSGVVITPDGYALSNFHVVKPAGDYMQCSMPDGRLYDAVIVGVDPVGDVALIQLLGRDDFPIAEMGDSSQVQVGDWCFAVGNPFLLATDFQPTVSYGIVSGVHRYQYPAGTLLEYADCIQTDAAINPGNSGGPLFNAEGQLIGINGRGSFEKRGRVNVGVGYAISINQIKNFLGDLRSGRIVDHATLGANMTSDDQGRVIVADILPDSDAYRRGLRYGDEILAFGGRTISTVNQFKNVLGTFPRGWRIPLSYRRDGQRYDVLVRLAGVHNPEELYAQVQPRPPAEPAPDAPRPAPHRDRPPSPRPAPTRPEPTEARQIPPEVARMIEPRRGYANYHYNQLHRDRVWNGFMNDSLAPAGDWGLEGQLAEGGRIELRLGETAVEAKFPALVAALNLRSDLADQLAPPGSGGLLTTMYLWRRMLQLGPERFGEVYYLGSAPLADRDGLFEVLVAVHDVVEVRFYFHPRTRLLAAMEMFSDPDRDPCEIYFDDYQSAQFPWLPRQLTVRYADNLYATLLLEDVVTVIEPPATNAPNP